MPWTHPPYRERLYLLACAAMFTFGIVLGLPGTVLGLPEVVDRFGLALADRGVLISTLFFGLLIGSIASGPLVDAIGQRATLAASTAAVGMCLPLFAAAATFPLAAGALGAIGLACAGMNTASNALTSDLFPEQRARRMNGIAIMVGLGGLAMPAATVLAADRVSWRGVVLGGAALALVVALAATRVTIARQNQPPAVFSLAAFGYFMRQPGFGWFCALLMLGAAMEASMAGWTSTYLNAMGFTPSGATWALSSHWLGLITGRLLFAGRVGRAQAAAVMRSGATGAAAVVLFVTTHEPVVLAVAPFAIGVAIALVVPTSLAFAGERYRGHAGTLFGILLTLAQVGGMGLPALIGLVADRGGLQLALSLLAVNSVLISVTAWMAARSAPAAIDLQWPQGTGSSRARNRQ